MKKSLVLAIALTLGVAGSAFAANPFSDVPANHWAYAAVEKLAAEGVVDGMGNGKYEGNRNMTRYEMAQITAKAMAKGVQKAEVKKLATEFAQELNALGVRVAKVEQKVQINGEFRLRYRGVQKAEGAVTPGADDFQLRTRLHLNGVINKNWSAYMLLENIQNLGSNSSGTAAESTLYLRRAVATGKYDKFQVQLGRIGFSDKDGMLFNPVDLDGITMSYNFGEVKATALYGRFAPFNNGTQVDEAKSLKDKKVVIADNFRQDTLGLALDWAVSKQFDLGAAFYNHKIKGVYNYENNGLTSNVWDVLATYKVQDWKFSAMYIGSNQNLSDSDIAKNGYGFRVAYGNFSPAKKGSYLVQANYFKIPMAAWYGSPYQAEDISDAYLGAKGWSLAADYAIDKNIRLHASYTDAKDASNLGLKTKVYTGYVQFFF